MNAQGVLAHLHANGYAGDSTLHGYHCDCEDCAFGNGWAFRGQTDSSCAGEIISDVFGGDDEETDEPYEPVALMGRLADAAIAVDAEPGLNAAFHVHVFTGDLPSPIARDAYYQFLRWEPVLQQIAGGRWTTQRPAMNRTVRHDMSDLWSDLIGGVFNTSNILAAERDGDELADFKYRIYNWSREADRHSNLNTRTRARTWEFRLWNSTRSAWRMEMFCGLSVALTDIEVVNRLSELSPPERMRRPSTGTDNIALALSDAGYEDIAEYVQRQAHYLDNRAGEAPALLTAL